MLTETPRDRPETANSFPLDYRVKLGNFLRTIEEEVREGKLMLEKNYETTTSSGKPIAVAVLGTTSEENAHDLNTSIVKRYHLLAIDSNRRIIGYHTSYIHQRPDDFTATHYITTGERGIGLSTAIESTFIAQLKEEATRRGKPVIWLVNNLGEEYDRKMQTRWKAAYDYGGAIFGELATAKGLEKSRTFSPQNPESIVRENHQIILRTVGMEGELETLAIPITGTPPTLDLKLAIETTRNLL